MKIEVLRAPGCPKCERELGGLREAALQLDPGVAWAELDIAQSIDYAVELGALKAPAVAIDGELAFTALPAPAALVAAMRQRAKARG